MSVAEIIADAVRLAALLSDEPLRIVSEWVERWPGDRRSKTLADIQAKLTALAGGPTPIDPAAVEAVAQDMGTVVSAIDANTATLAQFDQSLNTTAVLPAA